MFSVSCKSALPVFTAENVPVEASSAPEIVPDRFVIFQRLGAFQR
jgi:hypothetical protein